MPKWVCVVFVGKIFQCSLALLRCVVERLEFLYFLLNADHGKIILRTVPFYACKSANHGTHLVSLFVITPSMFASVEFLFFHVCIFVSVSAF